MRPRFAIVSLSVLLTAALACKTADTGEADTQSEATGGNVADPFTDRCDPSEPDPCAEFGGEHSCCSDDPAAIDFGDLSAFVLPQYQGRDGQGTPFFSGGNNRLSRSGACVDSSSVTPGEALVDMKAQGCPVPCNPTWDNAEITALCGNGARCCMAQEIQPQDCIFDSAIGCWRPVTGRDITGFGGADATTWAPNEHATHQDPGGTNCTLFAEGIPATLFTDYNITQSDLLLACYHRLTVANQRGWCSNSLGLDTCPYEDPAYVDACEQLNLDQGFDGC